MSGGFSRGFASVTGGAATVLAQAKARKRPKTVFSTGEIPHLWAHKVQPHATNPQRNLYYRNETIFSYGSHFPIARHVTNAKGKPAVFLTVRTWPGGTTSGHISAVRSSIPSNVPVFNITHPTDFEHSQMVDYVRRVAQIAENAFGRKMETTRNDDVNEALELVTECKAFCKFFKVKLPKFAKLPKIDKAKLKRQIDARKAREEARNAVRKAEWEARAAENKARNDAWNASGFCKHEPKHDANKYSERGNCERQTEEELWEAQRDTVIAAWRNGDPSARLRNTYNMPVMLRVRTFGADEEVAGEVGRVETSRGAQVPISHAVRALRFVRAVVARGEAFETNGKTLHLGHYKVTSIAVDGTLTVGCHVISLDEIERVAPELGRLIGEQEVAWG